MSISLERLWKSDNVYSIHSVHNVLRDCTWNSTAENSLDDIAYSITSIFYVMIALIGYPGVLQWVLFCSCCHIGWLLCKERARLRKNPSIIKPHEVAKFFSTEFWIYCFLVEKSRKSSSFITLFPRLYLELTNS